MYRSTGDINDCFKSMRDIAVSQIDKLCCTAVGCFNDIDMLTCGMYGKGNVAVENSSDKKQYDIDYKTEFALWCMFSAPLMIGCDIRKINDTTLKLLKNKTFIRINQDEECRPPFVATGKDSNCPTFVKHLSDNEFAVLFTNLGDYDTNCNLYFDEIGIKADSGYGLHMVDAFSGEDIGVKKEFMNMRLDKHDCALYLCTLEK